MKKVLGALAALALCASMAAAEVPDPLNSSVDPCDDLEGMLVSPRLPAPAPASVITVTVRNSSNAPINNSAVVVELGPSIELCGSTVLTGSTNTSGVVVLTLGGGGCAHQVALSGIVRASGIAIRTYDNVKSPDYDGVGANLAVTIADFTQFSGEFGGSLPSACHDYDNNGATGLSDLIIFGDPFQDAASCAP